jgi:predicted permease
VLRYALRTLLRSRALTVTAVLTLGLAVGANTALFSLVNAILLRPLPGVADPGRLVNVHRTAAGGTTFHSFSHPDYVELSERSGRFVRLAAFNGRGASLGTSGAPEVVGTQLVSGNYFGVLGVRPLLGRLLSEADDRVAGASPVAVVSHSLWQRRLGGDRGVVGRTIRLNGFPFTVVGVAPEGFQGHFVGFPFEVWVPLAMAAQAAPGEDLASREAEWLELVGRLQPGVSRPQAQAGLAAAMAGLAHDHPLTLRGASVDVRPMTGVDDSLRSGVVGFLAVLQAVGILVLLIACVNLAGLLLARAAGRARELAVRMALGAGQGALTRQLMAETLALFVLGGLAGVALASSSADLLHAFQPAFPVPLHFDLSLDLRVLAFAIAATVLTGVVCGLVPALHAGRVDILTGLKDARLAGTPRLRLRGLLVAGQVALTTLLLVGAGLFLRTLQTARSVDRASIRRVSTPLVSTSPCFRAPRRAAGHSTSSCWPDWPRTPACARRAWPRAFRCAAWLRPPPPSARMARSTRPSRDSRLRSTPSHPVTSTRCASRCAPDASSCPRTRPTPVRSRW